MPVQRVKTGVVVVLGATLALRAQVLWQASPAGNGLEGVAASSTRCEVVGGLRADGDAIQVGPGAGAGLRTPEIAVRERRAYRLSFQTRLPGSAATADATVQRERFHGKELQDAPWWRVHFLAADGTTIAESPPAHRRMARLGSDWRGIVDEFYTPDRCARVGVSLGSGSPVGVLFVADFRLEEIPPGTLLNLNPDFALGDTNYSGYHATTYLTQLETRPDGKVVLDMSTPGWIIGDRIPVTPGQTLRLSFSAVGTCPTANCCGRLVWYRPDGTAAGETENLWVKTGTDRELEARYSVPAGVTWVAIIVGNGTFRWVKLGSAD